MSERHPSEFNPFDDAAQLRRYIEDLRAAHAAIRNLGVDAVIAPGPSGDQLYTLTIVNRPYRLIIEKMGEGAATVSRQGIILYANQRLTELLKCDRGALVGHDVTALATGRMAGKLAKLIPADLTGTTRDELEFTRSDGSIVPVQVTVTGVDVEGVLVYCMVISDLTAVKQSQRQLVAAERRASQYEEQRDIAERLQRSLLPASLPQSPSLTLAAAYRPAGHSLAVGGDWYDALTLDRQVGLVIGDVTGHGISAAVVMGRLRTAMQVYLADGLGPARALARLNHIIGTFQLDTLATAAIVIVDPETGVFRYGTAGHLSPLIRRADGSVDQVDGASGPILGLSPDAEYTEGSGIVEDGGALLLFTDGLVERRDKAIDAGVAVLANAFAEPIVNAESHVERLLRAAATRLGPLSRDDVALLVAHRHGRRDEDPATGPADIAQPDRSAAGTQYYRSAAGTQY